jgi:hypothetical protein
VALRLKPADTTFYAMLTESARHLVHGAALLAEMLGDGNDRDGIAAPWTRWRADSVSIA